MAVMGWDDASFFDGFFRWLRFGGGGGSAGGVLPFVGFGATTSPGATRAAFRAFQRAATIGVDETSLRSIADRIVGFAAFRGSGLVGFEIMGAPALASALVLLHPRV